MCLTRTALWSRVCGHPHEVTYLLQHATQGGMILVHDLSLMVPQTQRYQRPLETRRMTAARPHLFNP